MNRVIRLTTTLLGLLTIASASHAIGISGTVFDFNAAPVWPCDIDVIDRTTGQQVLGIADSTLPNGNYNLVLANGRYDLLFRPKVGNHIFKANVPDQRVSNNTLTVHMTLPLGKYVKGRVVGTDNLPVANVNIKFATAAGATPANLQDSATNPDGTFNALVDPGFWNIEVIPANVTHKVPVIFENANVTADVNLNNIVVVNGSIMTCSISDPSLFPIAGAKLIVRTVPGRDKMYIPANNTNAAGVVTAVLPQGIYDFIGEPPASLLTTYGTLSQYNIVVGASDVTLPNFALPPGRQLLAHVVSAGAPNNVVGADIDVDWMVSPTYPRVETPNDFTNTLGNFSVTVGAGLYRLTIQPPVATKLLPVRIPNISIGATSLNMGTIVCPLGHWLDINVVEAGTGLPIAGANIDLDNLNTGLKLITIDDITNLSGFARIVSDTAFYRVKISPPSASYDTAYVVGGFRSTNDTVITVVMRRKTTVLGVGDRGPAAIRMASPWPNPSRTGTRFAFAGHGQGELDIVDISGRLVATPWKGTIDGEQTAQWTGSDDSGRGVPDGIYFARLRIGSDTNSRRVVVSR